MSVQSSRERVAVRDPMDHERVRVFAIIAASGVGGAEEVFASLLRKLDSDRFEIRVACHGEGTLLPEFRRHARDVWSLDLLRIGRRATVRRLAQLIAEARSQIVHTHLWTADVIGGLAARRARVPHIVSSVQGSYFLPVGANGWRRWRRRVMSRTYRGVYRWFDRVIAASAFVATDLAGRPGWRVPQGKLQVIHNGVDLARIDRAIAARAAHDRGQPSETSHVIATVANFYPIKGHEYLLRAMPAVVARCPDVRLVLAGDGDTRREMEQLTRQLGLDARVSFPGEVTNSLELMLDADLVVMPSVSEGLPITLLEAMALERPVVATRTGGIPEVVDHGTTGTLVPPRDPDALGQAISDALVGRARAERMARRARAVVRGRFSADRMVEETAALYDSLVGGTAASR